MRIGEGGVGWGAEGRVRVELGFLISRWNWKELEDLDVLLCSPFRASAEPDHELACVNPGDK